MLKSVAKVATVAIVGALALTGCSVTNPQVAAYVDGTPVSQTEVDTVSRVLAESTADPLDTAGSFAPTVLTIIVQSKLAAKTAAEKGITVTEAQRQTVIAQNEVYGTLLGNPATAAFMTGFANASVILSDQSAVPVFQDVVARTPVRVNPRFGEWNKEQAALAEGSSGSLSELAPLPQQ